LKAAPARVARWYIFKPKILIWVNFDDVGMETVGVFKGHSEFVTAILYILWPFGNLVPIWYIFPRFGILCQEKSGNRGPGSHLHTGGLAKRVV
jgi:hypothetical protein